MKAVILNGARKDRSSEDSVHKIIVDELTTIGWEVQTFTLCDMKIAHCSGCFECWIKTPGICKFDDGGREIAEQFIQSDLSILYTPVTFGGYSSELKKALDRIICLISPFFTKINGETHHKRRYRRYPRLMGIGTIPSANEESKKIFKTLFDRNALNLHPPAYIGEVILSNQSTKNNQKQIQSLLTVVSTYLLPF